MPLKLRQESATFPASNEGKESWRIVVLAFEVPVGPISYEMPKLPVTYWSSDASRPSVTNSRLTSFNNDWYFPNTTGVL